MHLDPPGLYIVRILHAGAVTLCTLYIYMRLAGSNATMRHGNIAYNFRNMVALTECMYSCLEVTDIFWARDHLKMSVTSGRHEYMYNYTHIVWFGLNERLE